jgi:hypothetical protein
MRTHAAGMDVLGGTVIGADAIPEPDYLAMTPLMAAALKIADGEYRKGVVETPPASNRGPDVDKYLIGRRGDGRDMLCMKRYVDDSKDRCPYCYGQSAPTPQCKGAPWCARFALWCVQGAADQLGIPDPTKGGGDLAGATKWINWAKKTNRLANTPRSGDIIAVPGHVMMCANASGDGKTVSTREGNSSNRVNAHVKPVTSKMNFIRIEGAGADAKKFPWGTVAAVGGGVAVSTVLGLVLYRLATRMGARA